MREQFAAYILYSPSCDRYYIGQTSDIIERAEGHVNGRTQATRMAKDWELVFVEPTENLQEAVALERRIKRTKSRKSIKRYIRDTRNIIPESIPLTDITTGRSAAWQRVSFGS